MARKTPTVKQWKEIEQRFYAGETASNLAREYGITEGAIRNRFGAKKKEAKNLANQIVIVEEALKNTDLTTKTLARSYADKIMAMHDLSADVAINGLNVAKRVGDILNRRMADKMDDELMSDEALSQLAKAGTVINIHSKPAIDCMEGERKNLIGKDDDKGDYVIKIEGGLPD